jgi:hypothetical protein
MSREDVAEFSRVNLPRADYLAEESPIDLLEAVSLEGATRRNVTGEEASGGWSTSATRRRSARRCRTASRQTFSAFA